LTAKTLRVIIANSNHRSRIRAGSIALIIGVESGNGSIYERQRTAAFTGLSGMFRISETSTSRSPTVMVKASTGSNELLKCDARFGGKLTATSCSAKESNNSNERKVHEEKKRVKNGLPMKTKERNGNRQPPARPALIPPGLTTMTRLAPFGNDSRDDAIFFLKCHVSHK